MYAQPGRGGVVVPVPGGIALAALVLAGGPVVAAAPDPDPWAPGASRPPWPLIAELQSSAALGSDERAWVAALGHPDPLVRAAAAWAAGRTRPRHASRLLAPLVTDPDIRVRDAALWAVLALDDETSLASVARALAARRRLSSTGRLFARRGIPAEVAGRDAMFRRDWLASVDITQLRPGHARLWQITVESATLSIERSEWDADERASVRANVATSGGSRPERLLLRSHLVPLDEPAGIPEEMRQRVPVALRRVEGEPSDLLQLAPTTRYELELMLSFHDIPPGAYLLEGLQGGHPLLLRVRRSPRREPEVQRAAQTAQTTEDIEAVGRQRVAAATPRLRERLRAELAGSRGPPVWPLLSALARLQDSESAALLIDALHDRRGLSKPGPGSSATSLEVMAFGPAVLPHLERLARRWPDAVRRIGGDEMVVSALGAAAAVSPGLDEARMEALRTLAPQVTLPGEAGTIVVGTPEANRRDVFLAALGAIAGRRAEEVGRVLASLADRPQVLARAIQVVDPFDYAAGLHATDADAIETMLTTAWRALDERAPADSRSAIAAAAERLGIPLPGGHDARPASAAEASREMARTRRAPRGPREALLRRVLASGLAQREPAIAVSAAEFALDLDLYDQASRLAERALELAPAGPERGAALLVRGRVRAASGDLAGQRADLEAALPLLTADDSRVEEARNTLADLRGDTCPERLRVRVRPSRPTWNTATLDGGRIVAGGDQRIERIDVLRGGTTIIAVAPWPVSGLASVDARTVVAIADDGFLALLRQGVRRPVWEARVDEWCRLLGAPQCGALAADRQTVVVRDLASEAHAFDTSTGRKLWSRPAAEGPPLVVNGSDPVVLGTPPARAGHPVHEIAGVDPRNGRVVWSGMLSGRAQSWAITAHRLAWLDRYGGLRVLDVRDGRELINLELNGGAPLQTPVAAVTVGPDGSRAYAAIGDALFAVGPAGVIWSYVPSPAAPEAERATLVRLQAGADALWQVVQVRSRTAVTAWSPSGERVAERRWPGSIRGGPWLGDGRVVEVLLEQSSELLDLLPAPPP